MDADPRDDWSGARAYIAVLVGFKLVGLGIVVWAMARAGALDGAVQFLIAYHVPFFLPLLALAWSPTRRWCRRLRARFRRRQLLWAEWHVGETAPSP